MVKRAKDDDASSDSTPQPVLKRPRRLGSTQSIDHARLCYEIYEAIRNYRSDDGRILCEPFLRLPSKRVLPEYHKMVSNPIDFMRIQQKIKTDEYNSLEQMSADIKLLVENSKTFYKKNSQEHKDACDLFAVYNDIKAKYVECDEFSEISGNRSDVSSPAPSMRSLRSSSPSRSTRSKDTSPGRFSVSGTELSEKWVLEEFLASILSITDETDRRICHAFVMLPSKEECPDYYRVIKDPIDLKTIADKLDSNRYRNLKDLEQDLNNMCRNAKRYNEPGSLIYKDANFMKKSVAAKKAEFMELGVQGIEKNKHPNASALIDDLLRFAVPSTSGGCGGGFGGGQSCSAFGLIEEDSEDEDTKFVPDDKFSALYTTVRYARDETGSGGSSADLIEPFLRLPSRAFYPDYYDEIKQPMSLFVINRKIKMDEYNNFEEMVSDVNLMFNNAMTYNMEGSTVYTNAFKLQSICNHKVSSLDSSIDTSQYVTEVPLEIEAEDFDPSLSPSSGNSSPAALKVAKLKLKVPAGYAGATDKPRGRPGRKSMDELMIRYRNKLMMLYRAVADYKDLSGICLSEPFMEKPSRKIYPDYYYVINNPIDLKTIRANIENDKYSNTLQVAADFELLFGNAKKYNQPQSQIYKDAVTLDSAFKNALRQLGPTGIESPKLLKEKFGLHGYERITTTPTYTSFSVLTYEIDFAVVRKSSRHVRHIKHAFAMPASAQRSPYNKRQLSFFTWFFVACFYSQLTN